MNLEIGTAVIIFNVCCLGAWHENFEKLLLLKLVDKVSFHLNISPTMEKMQTCISFGSIYLLFYLVWWPRFIFQATFLLIFPKLFGIFTLKFTTKVRKIWLNFWYQNHNGFWKNWGMMLWIMSGTFNCRTLK